MYCNIRFHILSASTSIYFHRGLKHLSIITQTIIIKKAIIITLTIVYIILLPTTSKILVTLTIITFSINGWQCIRYTANIDDAMVFINLECKWNFATIIKTNIAFIIKKGEQ